MWFNVDTFEIEVRNVKGKGAVLKVDVSMIREIRRNDTALRTAEFAEGPEIVDDLGSQARSICIMYGDTFKLDQLAFVRHFLPFPSLCACACVCVCT